METFDWAQVMAWRLRRHQLEERAPADAMLAVTSRIAGLHAQVTSWPSPRRRSYARWSSPVPGCRTNGVNAPPPTTLRYRPGSRVRATGTSAYGRGT